MCVRFIPGKHYVCVPASHGDIFLFFLEDEKEKYFNCIKNKNKTETRMTASVLKQDPNT